MDDWPSDTNQQTTTLTDSKGAVSRDWHLICITRLGKVSILKDLDLRTARLTYQKLMPDTQPKSYIFSDRGGNYSVRGRSYVKHDDCIERVEAIGPEGIALDAWQGVESIVVDFRSNQERCEAADLEAAKFDPARTDIWNDPEIWTGIQDPHKEMFWMKETNDDLRD